MVVKDTREQPQIVPPWLVMDRTVRVEFPIFELGKFYDTTPGDYPSHAYDPFVNVWDAGSRLEAYCSAPNVQTGDLREQVFPLLDEFMQQSGFRQETPPPRISGGGPSVTFYVKDHARHSNAEQ